MWWSVLFFTLGTLVGHLGSQWISYKNAFFRVFHSALMASVDKKCKHLRCCRKNNHRGHTIEDPIQSFPSPSEIVKMLSLLNSLKSRIDIKSLLSLLQNRMAHTNGKDVRRQVLSNDTYPFVSPHQHNLSSHSIGVTSSTNFQTSHPHILPHPRPQVHTHSPHIHSTLRHRVPLRKPSSHLLSDVTKEYVSGTSDI